MRKGKGGQKYGRRTSGGGGASGRGGREWSGAPPFGWRLHVLVRERARLLQQTPIGRHWSLRKGTFWFFFNGVSPGKPLAVKGRASEGRPWMSTYRSLLHKKGPLGNEKGWRSGWGQDDGGVRRGVENSSRDTGLTQGCRVRTARLRPIPTCPCGQRRSACLRPTPACPCGRYRPAREVICPRCACPAPPMRCAPVPQVPSARGESRSRRGGGWR